MRHARRLTLLGMVSLIAAAIVGCALFNGPPIASFTATPATGPAPLIVHFDASGSSDPNSDPLEYAWTYGDGSFGDVLSGFHTYTAPGEYEVELTVTDAYAETSTMTRAILVTAPDNAPPTASFTVSLTTGAAPLIVALNASASNDPDGTIVSYEWSFGDGNTGTGMSGLHTFASQGAYIVTLTVTNNEGATATATTAILVTSPGNQLPVASFTADPTASFVPFDVDFDASASFDPDGIIAMYSWDFGDGDTGVGQTITHTFDTFGKHTVTLTVIDNNGAPAQHVEEVTGLIFITPIFIPLFP
ncbi:PKD domain-containing protein [Candidatus Bipolaricaulota bacterium]